MFRITSRFIKFESFVNGKSRFHNSAGNHRIFAGLQPTIPGVICHRSMSRMNTRSTGKMDGRAGFLLLVPIATFGLGCWQVYRKFWKEKLIKEMQKSTNAAPIPIPENLADLGEMEYRPVIVRGHFIHEKELYMGPRSYMSNGDTSTKSSLMSENSDHIGYLVITPFKLADREETILINRGWVGKKQVNPITRPAGQVEGEVEIIGVVRLNETRPQFSPESRGSQYLYRDLPKMCVQTGAEPYFLDARSDSNTPGGPIGGQTRVTLRNEHLSYIVTWFTLSGCTSYVWFQKVFRRIPTF